MFSSTLNGFPIGDNQYPLTAQMVLVVRNIDNGAFYAIWWDHTQLKFLIGTIISGNAPQNGDRVAVCYISNR